MADEILFYIRKEPNGFLSNFWRAPQTIDRAVYPTNEHYYQSMKAKFKAERDWIAAAPRAYYAMIAGRALHKDQIRDNWEDVKLDFMLKGLQAKFTQNQDLAVDLLDTGDAILHENSLTDVFWGIHGKSMLGILLMKVRDELKNQQ